MERHQFPLWIIALFIVASVFIESKLPLWFWRAAWLDLPLIVTVYFGLKLQSPLRGLSVGVVAGLLQDALSHGPVGLNGLSKTIVGFVASSFSRRIEAEHIAIRAAALLVFSVVDLAILAFLERLFYAKHFSWAHYHFVYSPLLNVVIGLPVFWLGDRFRRQDW